MRGGRGGGGGVRGWREEGREEGMGRDGVVLRGLWEKKRSEASEEEESPSVRLFRLRAPPSLPRLPRHPSS